MHPTAASGGVVLGQRYCFITAAIALGCPPSGRGEHAWRRKRHGAPNREPPEIRSGQTAESLCPVRGDDLPAGMVRVSGPAPRAASLGMRSVRLQIRDAGHVPRPIVCIRARNTMRRATGRAPVALRLGVGPADLKSAPTDRCEIGAQLFVSATAGGGSA